MKINVFDSNVHSDNSIGGKSPILTLADKAAEKNMIGFSVTDHFECIGGNISDQTQRIKQSVFETELAANTVKYKLKITKGIMLGEPQLDVTAAENILKVSDFDFVLGAVRRLSNGVMLSDVNFDDPDIVIGDILKKYFEDCVELSKCDIYDSFAHFCYPERFIWGRSRIPFHIDEYTDYVDEVLKNLIANGKALEVNTYGLRTSMAKTSPHMSLVKRYKELGGELVTFGSDAYSAEDMAYGFELIADQLIALGIKYLAVYRGREPRMLKII